MSEVVESHATAASEATIEGVAAALRDRNIDVVVVEDGEAARRFVLEQLPDGAEVYSGKSKTLEDAGIYSELQESGRYDFLRKRMLAMDRETQAREMRKLIAAPDYMLGSVGAVTEDGVLVAASATASQLGPYAAGAGKVILVIGSQKIVPDLAAAFQRIREYIFPWEDARVHESMGVSTILGKVLLIEREWRAHRTTVVLVRRPIGI